MSDHLPECPQCVHWREHFDDYPPRHHDDALAAIDALMEGK